jgi:hypothetical protein
VPRKEAEQATDRGENGHGRGRWERLYRPSVGDLVIRRRHSQDALHAAREAAVLYQQLTARSPTAFTPHLTASLSAAVGLLDLMG